MLRKAAFFLASSLFAAVVAWGGNGHLLHGVGAVNSSMGGVATALPVDIIGALHVNPALLTQFQGDQIGFSTEVFSDQPKATATFLNSPGRPNGSFTTEGRTEPGVVPAIGFSHRARSGPWALGFGLLGVAGFRTDWPQDPGNPIFAPQPDGFGAVKTDLVISKIPLAFAYQLHPNLSLGISLALYQGGLAISPLPPAAPECTLPRPGSGRAVDCFYLDASNRVTSYAAAVQLGLYYNASSSWALGFSYTSPQDFEDYVWSSAVALPYLRDPADNVTLNPAFGSGREIRYALDGPELVSVGVGFTPGAKLKLGFDARWVNYSDVDGAGGVGGFRPDRSLNEIGWDDILVGAIGFEYQTGPVLTIRGGFNYSETPIRKAVAFTSLGTPPTFQDHYTVGLGLKLTDKIRIDVGAYWAPEREVSGPLLTAFAVPTPENLNQQQVPGGTFTIAESILSGLFALSYGF